MTRGGKRIASIGPATACNGADVRALLGSRGIDQGFASDVAAALDAATSEGPVWPAD